MSRSSHPAPPLDDPILRLHAAEQAADQRVLRGAVTVAVALHAGLLLVQLPRLEARAVLDTPKRAVYAVTPVRFRPPEAERPRPLPQKRARRVPVPDPTPDQPEPLRAAAPEAFVVPDVGDVVVTLPVRAPESPRDPGPVRLTAAMERPVKLHAPNPQYTEIARRARVEGTVVLEAVIETDGTVRDVTVLRDLPMGLGGAAVVAVERWRFEPARLDGRPVAVILSLTVTFSLQ
ncbi:MAG TPA: TonB family protein [Thermoanaerobaculia bacterium]|nr:TonB family protein [Thermoanaerobaculia bacterium]